MQRYTVELLQQQCKNIFSAIGIKETDVNTATKLLVGAELRGINSHGLIRIMDYVGLWQKGRINTQAQPKIVHQSPSTAVVDGDNGFGVVVAEQGMKIAIDKARNCGSGWVSMNNSNHFGIAGHYAMMALEEDMIGIAMTNANPLVAPTWSTSRLLGTNPIAVAIPAGKEKPFIADFATTPIARGKLAVMHKKGLSAPDGYVQDGEGQPSNDPNILTEGGAILPLGGDYEHGSHKGYCMGSIVDIFSAVFSGANFGPFVPPQVPYLNLKPNLPGKGLGHFFGAMRIDGFQKAEEFKDYMDQWLQCFKQAQPAKGHEKVYIPGEPEREKEAFHYENGIEVLPKIVEELAGVCEQTGAEFILK